jgi:hypothetical protein
MTKANKAADFLQNMALEVPEETAQPRAQSQAARAEAEEAILNPCRAQAYRRLLRRGDCREGGCSARASQA